MATPTVFLSDAVPRIAAQFTPRHASWLNQNRLNPPQASYAPSSEVEPSRGSRRGAAHVSCGLNRRSLRVVVLLAAQQRGDTSLTKKMSYAESTERATRLFQP